MLTLRYKSNSYANKFLHVKYEMIVFDCIKFYQPPHPPSTHFMKLYIVIVVNKLYIDTIGYRSLLIRHTCMSYILRGEVESIIKSVSM